MPDDEAFEYTIFGDDEPDTAVCAACWRPSFGALLCVSCCGAADRLAVR